MGPQTVFPDSDSFEPVFPYYDSFNAQWGLCAVLAFGTKGTVNGRCLIASRSHVCRTCGCCHQGGEGETGFIVDVEEGGSATFLGKVVAKEVSNVFAIFRNAGALE